jgi:hypothetical protein
LPGTAAPTVPAGFGVALTINGANVGAQVDGQITLNATASTHGVVSSLRYTITGPNNYSASVTGANEAGGFRGVWDSTGLPAGRYLVQAVTTEVDHGTYYWPQTAAGFKVGACRIDSTGSYASVALGIAVDSCVSVSSSGVVTATVRYSNPNAANTDFCVAAVDGKTGAQLGWSACGPWTTSTSGAIAHEWQPAAGTSFRIAVGFWSGGTFYGRVESPLASAP